MDFSDVSTEDLQSKIEELKAQYEALSDDDVDAKAEVLDQIEAVQAELERRSQSETVEASKAENAKRWDAIGARLFSVRTSKGRKTPVDKVGASLYADTYRNLRVNYDWTKALVDRLEGRSHYGAEREYIQEARNRNPKLAGVPIPRIMDTYAGANTTDAPNAQTVNYVQPQVDMLRAGSIVDELGITVMDGLTEAQTFTVQTKDPVGNWVGEGNDSSAGTPEYKQITVSPKTNIIIVPTSLQFLLTVPNAKEQLGRQISERALIEYNSAFVSGAGGAAPTGVLNDSSIQANAGSTYNFAGNLTLDGVVAMEAQCATNNGLKNPVWLSNWKVRAQGKKTAKGSNIYQTIIDDDERMIGHRFVANSLVPSNLGTSPPTKSPLVLFGDPSTCIAAIFGGDNFELRVDQYTQLASGGIRLAVPISVDFKFLQPDKIVVAKDITAG
jgi:hypothetical protein